LKLYGYYRSSAAYRVRIALNLKGIEYEQQIVNLLTAEEQQESFSAINPQKLVPVLEDNGQLFFQSMAILEYLEEVYPQTPILPDNSADRAWVRALSNIVACDIHPLNNLRVLKYLVNDLNVGEVDKINWYRHWVIESFRAFEAYLQKLDSGNYCFGEQPGMADILLIPQVYNARRFEVDMTSFPRISKIEQHCLSIPAFEKAIPENQPDAN